MQAITSIEECNAAAVAIGNPKVSATTTDDTPTPEGCYANANLWVATNPSNKGNGEMEEGQHPICKIGLLQTRAPHGGSIIIRKDISA